MHAVGDGSPALWRQLIEVSRALQGILEGRSSRTVLAQVPAQLRPGVQSLLFRVLRHLGRAQALLQQLAPRKPPAQVHALLCTALALAWDEAQAPYAPFTLVNQAVEAAKHGPARAQTAFVNACLRRFLRERAQLIVATNTSVTASWEHPSWWIERLRKDYPEEWQGILYANNLQAPLTLRVNQRKSEVEPYLQALDAMHIEATRVALMGVELKQAVPVAELPGFAEGKVSVQDAAAQLAAPLLLDSTPWPQDRPLRVLDACAAPGGKTAHLLEQAGARAIKVTALEIDPERAERIGQTLRRLDLSAQVLVGDAASPEEWFSEHCANDAFDAILLDAPCSASGIVRRQPDVRWLRRESDIAQLERIQSRLLDTLWPLLAVGGALLYCTCSVFKAEGEEQIKAFLSRNSQAQRLPAPGHLLPGKRLNAETVADNGLGDHDGFFYALLRKTA